MEFLVALTLVDKGMSEKRRLKGIKQRRKKPR